MPNPENTTPGTGENTESTEQDTTQSGEQSEEQSFDQWLSTQDESVRKMYEDHTHGLRSALASERQSAKDLTKQLKKLSSELDQSSEAAKQLNQLSGKLEAAQLQADFYEEASKAGCRDLRLAWLAAQADGLSVEDVKEQHPELFRRTPPDTNAGTGNNNQNHQVRDMNTFIRRAAGRR